MKRYPLLLALLSLCLVASVAWWLFQPTTGSVRPAHDLPKPDAPSESAAAPVPPDRAFRWEVGAVAFYDLETGVALAPAEEGAQITPGSALLIHGILRLEVLRIAPLEIGATVTSAQVLREGAPDQQMETMLAATPCLLRMQRDGSIEETAFSPEVPEEDRNLVRLACAWEFCLQPKTTWTSQEKSPGSKGIFQATYVALPGGMVKKSRTFLPSGDESGSQRVLFSEFIARPGALWLEALEGRESTELLLDGEPMARSLVHVRLTRLSEGPATTSASPDPRAFDGFSTGVAANPRESVNAQAELDNLRKLYGAVPLGTIVAKLAAVREKAMQEKLPALRELADWLRAHGSAGAMQTVAALQEGKLEEADAGLAVHAIGNAKEADALASLLEAPDKIAPNTLLQAIIEAGGVQNPSERIVNALSELTAKEFPKTPDGEDYRVNDAAWYNLARLAEKDPVLRQRLEDSLLPALKGSEPAMLDTALRALANARSGNPDVLAAATATLATPGHAESTEVAALGLLGQSSAPLPPEAVEAASAALAPTRVSGVQIAALELFAERPESLNATISERIGALRRSANSSVADAAQKASAQLAR